MLRLRSDHRENQVSDANARAEIATSGAKVLPFPAINRKGIAQGENGVTTGDASSVLSSVDVPLPDDPHTDWCILRDTLLRSVATSPEAFLATTEQLEAKPQEYWEDRLNSSTWAVVQRGSEILGIAAAKPPDEVDDYYALQEQACFIESVWIDPAVRGKGVGERLVTYIIEQERRARIQKFYLWVLNYNAPAIRLYTRMNFKPTERDSQLAEIQFLRAFDSDVIDDDELKRNAAARRRDRRRRGITYRLLTLDQAETYVAPSGRQTAGSMSRKLKAAIGLSMFGRLVR
jgi:ribosomal protein S18 acetylase RimI-like enzyme